MSKRVGIIGCGQLGQMLGHAAQRLKLDVCFLGLDESPVVFGAGKIFAESEVNEFLQQCDVVTVEREAIPEAILQAAQQQGKLAPNFAALTQLRSRDTQKALLDQLDIPTSPWQLVASPADLQPALAKLGAGRIRCKQVLGGYDGGGQWRLEQGSLGSIPESGYPLIAEREVEVHGEVAILLARDANGECVCYPITENLMRGGVLTWSFTPAAISDELTAQLREYGTRLANAVDYVGVMAIEFFISDGQLVANEVAPRVHNTGHWSLDACDCDQFEQHLRAVAGLPLVEPKQCEAAAMCNVLGDQLPRAIPDHPVRMYLHTYGKGVRPGRKLGHLTLVAPSMDSVRAAAAQDTMPGH